MSHDAVQLLTSITVAVATVVVAGATLYYAVLTRRLLKKQQADTEQLRKPNVIATLGPCRKWGNLFEVVVGNAGNVPAYHVKLDVTPRDLPARGNRTLGDVRIFGITIPVLLENQELRDFAIYYPDLLEARRQDTIVTIGVSYEDSLGRNFTNTFSYDLGIFEGLPSSGEKDLSDAVKELETLRTDLRRQNDTLAEALGRLEWRLGPFNGTESPADMLEPVLRAFMTVWKDTSGSRVHLVDPGFTRIRLLAEQLYYVLCAAQHQTKLYDDLRGKLLRMFDMVFTLGPTTAAEFSSLGKEAAELAEKLLEPGSDKGNEACTHEA